MSLSGIAFSAQLLNPEKINSEVIIKPDGKVSIQNAKIMQFAGSTIYVRLHWEESFIRMTVKTNTKTSLTRKFGENISVSDIKIGDRINVEGNLEPGPDSLTVNASSVVNLSDEREQNKFSGKIYERIGTPGGFLMMTNDGQIITIIFDEKIEILKGTGVVGYRDVSVGDIVQYSSGVFDHSKKTLYAKMARIFLDMNQFKSRNFQGTLRSISGTTLPTIITVNVDSKDYTIKLGAECSVMNTMRKPLSLSRFVIGDTVRFYGAIREREPEIIDAIVVRNISL